MHDLVIKGGTIVDGTGSEPFEGDVAIDDGRISAVGGSVTQRGREEIDAKGKLVTPGFVDTADSGHQRAEKKTVCTESSPVHEPGSIFGNL